MPRTHPIQDLFIVHTQAGLPERTDVWGLNIAMRNHIPDLDPLDPFRRWLFCFMDGFSAFTVLVGSAPDGLPPYLPPPAAQVETSIYAGDLFKSPATAPGLKGFLYHNVDRSFLESLFDEFFPNDNALVVMPAANDVEAVTVLPKKEWPFWPLN